jgi:hypothetical protein
MTAWFLASFAVPAAAADAPLCDDCKFLPCVKMQIDQANEMRRMYANEASRATSLVEYQRIVAEKSQPILDKYSAMTQNVPACRNNFPNLEGPENFAAAREWTTSLHWGFKRSDDGKTVEYTWPANTDMESCKPRTAQLKKSREIVACLDLAEATEAHELKHAEQCLAKKPTDAATSARYEVEGYDVGTAKLKKTLERLKKKCPKPQPSGFTKAMKDRARVQVDHAKSRIMMYVTSGGH